MELRQGRCMPPGSARVVFSAARTFVATSRQPGRSIASGSLGLATAGQRSRVVDAGILSPISLFEESILERQESFFRLPEPAPSLRSDHRYATPLETSRPETNEPNTNCVRTSARRLQVTTSEIVIHG